MTTKTIVFNPGVSPVDALFAEWVKTYIAQANMVDDEADPFQEPLSKLEKAIKGHPLGSMQDFFQQQTVESCFGDFDWPITPDQRQRIYVVALAEASERESLLKAIEQHRAIYTACDTFTADTGREIDDDPEYEALAMEELELLNAVVGHPTSSISNTILKGRYLAAVQAVGGLGYEQAEAFVATLGGSDHA